MQAVEFKIALVGHTQTGKTSFVHRLLNEQTTNVPKTIGVRVRSYDFVHHATRYRFNIWDCAGDPKYAGLGRRYLTGSDLIVVFQDAKKDNSIFQQTIIPSVYASKEDNPERVLESIRRRLGIPNNKSCRL